MQSPASHYLYATKGANRTKIRNSKHLSIYERSLAQAKARQRKVEALRADAMEEYTFTPNRATSHHSHKTPTTGASSSEEESVFSRLYRKGNCVSPTGSAWSSPQRSDLTAHTDSKRTPSTMTDRIEEIYQRRVQSMRARPMTELEEKQRRDRNFEARESPHCTFRPKTHWGSKKPIPISKPSKLVMVPSPSRKSASLARREKNGKPVPSIKRSQLIMEPTRTRLDFKRAPSKDTSKNVVTQPKAEDQSEAEGLPVAEMPPAAAQRNESPKRRKSHRHHQPPLPKEILVARSFDGKHDCVWISPLRELESKPTTGPLREDSLDSFEKIAGRTKAPIPVTESVENHRNVSDREKKAVDATKTKRRSKRQGHCKSSRATDYGSI